MSDQDDKVARSAVTLKLLIRVALADGRWDEREVALLEELADALGINPADLKRFRKSPELEVAELSAGLPVDNAGRISLFADLVKMAYADRVVHESEMQLLIRLGNVLGFDEESVRGIVEEEGQAGTP